MLSKITLLNEIQNMYVYFSRINKNDSGFSFLLTVMLNDILFFRFNVFRHYLFSTFDNVVMIFFSNLDNVVRSSLNV